MPNDALQTIPDTNTDRQAHSRVPIHRDNFVIRGCELTLDTATNTLGVVPGTLTRTYNGTVYLIDLAARTGDDAIDVPDNSQLGVYYNIAPNQVVVQASPPSEPMLQLGTVDTAAGTATDMNRDPDSSFDTATAERAEAEVIDAESISNPNVLLTEEDDNSPVSLSGSSQTIQLSSDYDIFGIFFEFVRSDGDTSRDLSIQVDGVTSTDYFYRNDSNTRTTSDSKIVLGSTVKSNVPVFGWLKISRNFKKNPIITARDLTNESHPTFVGGTCTAASDPIDQFTVKISGDNLRGNIRLFGGYL